MTADGMIPSSGSLGLERRLLQKSRCRFNLVEQGTDLAGECVDLEGGPGEGAEVDPN